MKSLFNLEEANIILSALSNMDDFLLPTSVSRKDLYMLIIKLLQAMDLKMNEDGEMPIPNLFLDTFDISKLTEIDLIQVDMVYVLWALNAMISQEIGYPENINSISNRIYNRISSQLIDEIVDHPKDDVSEIVRANSLSSS